MSTASALLRATQSHHRFLVSRSKAFAEEIKGSGYDGARACGAARARRSRWDRDRHARARTVTFRSEAGI